MINDEWALHIFSNSDVYPSIENQCLWLILLSEAFLLSFTFVYPGLFDSMDNLFQKNV